MENKKSTKPKYGMLQNSLFMIREALETTPSVLWLTLLQAILAVAISVLELYVTPSILNSLEKHSALLDLLFTILFFTLGIMAVSALTAYVDKNQFFGRVEVRRSIIQKSSIKAESCSYPLTEDQDFINLLSKVIDITGSNDQATEACWNTFAGILENLIGFFIYLYLLTHADPLIVLVTTVTAVIGYLVSSRINGWGYRHRKEETNICNKLLYIRNKSKDPHMAKDIRIFGMEKWLKELHGKYLKIYQDFIKRRERIYLLADFTDLLLGLLRNGIAYAYLLYMTLAGNLSASEFLLYFTAVSGFTGWIGGIMENFYTLYKQSIDLTIVREFLDYQEIFLMENGKELIPDKKKSYTVELRDVTFRYPNSEKEIFSHLNLTIHSGEKLAVVGLNGAGKTTLIKLICGFYDPNEGEVLLNGINIKIYNRRDYYKLFAGVFQDFSLIAADVSVNVAQTDHNIDMEKVKACIEKAGLKKKIESLPKKYHTPLVREVYENATELSGGELQRLMLARLLYRDSFIIVLDEPTAALDAIAESDIYQRYHELTKGHTSIFISHRLASTRFCDRILLLDNGSIIEEGTHEELLTRGGAYSQLFEIQSKYYRKGACKNE